MNQLNLFFNLSFGICAATVKTIIRQNKKGALLEFLFGSQTLSYLTDRNMIADMQKDFQILKEKMEGLQNQVNFLQEKIIDLENQTKNFNDASKYPLRGV